MSEYSRLECTLRSAVRMCSGFHNGSVHDKLYTKQRIMHDEINLYTHDIGIQMKGTMRLTSMLEPLFAQGLALPPYLTGVDAN